MKALRVLIVIMLATFGYTSVANAQVRHRHVVIVKHHRHVVKRRVIVHHRR